MRVTTVHFSKTKQVNRFEPERIELTIALEEDESVAVAVEMARRTADALLGNIPDEREVEQARAILAHIDQPRFS